MPEQEVQDPQQQQQNGTSWLDTFPAEAKTDPAVTKYKTPEEFYKGYNAGIDSQFKYSSEIARVALAAKEKP